MKRMKWVIGSILILIIAAIVFFAVRRYILYSSPQVEWQKVPTEADSEKKETRMMALVDTEEEAQKIAEEYGIDMISYVNGVAVYTTDRDPQEIIDLGKENGYPELEVDSENYMLNS